MNTLEQLKEYRNILAEIRAIDLEIQELNDEDNIKGVSQCYEEKTGRTNKFNSIVENQAVNIQDKIMQLEYKKRCCERQIARIDNALSVLNEKEKRVLEMKYLKGLNWESITFSLDRTYQQCKKIEKQAIKTIEPLLVH